MSTRPTSPSSPGFEGDDRMLDELLARIAADDREALAALYQATYTAIFAFALSICQHLQDAEDVLQEVYLQVFRNAQRYVSHGKPLAWLLTIARNLSLMRLRDRGKAITLSPEDWQAQFADRAAVTPDDKLVLEALLNRLSDEERQIVVLHAISGLKHREIAVLLDLPLPTAISKYNRALEKLRNMLKGV